MKASHRKWVAEGLKHDKLKRQAQWTQNIAVGDRCFPESVKDALKHQIKGRIITEAETGDFQNQRNPDTLW